MCFHHQKHFCEGQWVSDGIDQGRRSFLVQVAERQATTLKEFILESAFSLKPIIII